MPFNDALHEMFLFNCSIILNKNRIFSFIQKGFDIIQMVKEYRCQIHEIRVKMIIFIRLIAK